MNGMISDSRPLINPTFMIGTSGWTYEHWKGCFYPESLPKQKWFAYYTSHFSTVEVNSTFYRAFKDETYQKWRQNSPQSFGFVLKAPQWITHRKLLLDVEQDIQAFYHSCELLEDKFKMMLLQVAPNMPCELKRLQAALHAFPDASRVAVEFRCAEWLNQDTLDLLQDVGATLCNVDSPQHPLTHYLTSDRAYLRLHGRKSWYTYNYSQAELTGIAELARDLAKRGARTVYIFFNNDYEGHAPANALDLIEKLNGA